MEKAQDTTKPFYRDLSFKRDAINVESRTVELAFSSEAPYERWFGMEILDHKASSVRLGRLNDGAPLLLNHDPDEQIGVVESVTIGGGVGRAVVRFGKGEDADEIFQDVIDGIRRKVSVGYMIHAMVLDSKNGDEETYRVNDWEPFEISIVSIPADNSVGVGRAIEEHQPIKKEVKMTDTNQAAEPAIRSAAPTVDVQAIQNEARSKELARINELEKVGQTFVQFGGAELARQYIAEGKSVSDLNAAILERAGKSKPTTGDIGMNEKETKFYSFARALNALANPNDRKAQEAASFEREVSEAAAKRSGKSAQGLIVPYDVLSAPMKRDLVVGTSTAGGHTVATELMTGSFIDLLRKRMVLNALGATVMNGLVGNIAIPRQTSGATAYWVAESGSPTESQQAFDQVTMSPKTVGAYTDYSRKLLLQSSIDVESFIRMDLTKQIGLEIDRVGLYGSGSSNQPQGIKGTSGINTVDFSAEAPTYAEIVQLETEVASDNADIGTLAYLTNAAGRGKLKTTMINATYGDRPIWEPGGTVNGYRCEVSNQVAGTGGSTQDFFFGNWADLLIGFWSGLDLVVDPYTGSTSGTVRVVALQDVDVAVRHPESFCRGANTL